MLLERLAAGTFALGLLCAPMLVPDWPFRHPREPAYWGVAGFASLALVLPGLRLWKGKGSALERAVLAGVLLGMPLVYVLCAWLRGAPAQIEWVGTAIFGGAALAGLRWPRVLVLGIAAHAVVWDARHVFGSEVVPAWYGWACLYADVALAIYAYAQLPEWEAE